MKKYLCSSLGLWSRLQAMIKIRVLDGGSTQSQTGGSCHGAVLHNLEKLNLTKAGSGIMQRAWGFTVKKTWNRTPADPQLVLHSRSVR